MPELPEVELVAKSLNKFVSGRKILVASLLRERLSPFDTVPDFARKLKDSRLNFVHRRGKHILFDLDSKQTLITHLRMTGRFMLIPIERELPKHSHAVFYLDDESCLIFQDQRHFGMMKIVDTAKLYDAPELSNLAPEPLSGGFTVKYLRAVLSRSRRPLKELLLDQTKVCGLGNIYVSESLFLAKIDPRTPADEISLRKIAILFKAIRDVLADAIGHHTTLSVDAENIDGSYFAGGSDGHWRVYDQEDKPCPNCRSDIKRIVQSARSSYFCPKCQKL